MPLKTQPNALRSNDEYVAMGEQPDFRLQRGSCDCYITSSMRDGSGVSVTAALYIVNWPRSGFVISPLLFENSYIPPYLLKLLLIRIPDSKP